jgi:hypothetical protein
MYQIKVGGSIIGSMSVGNDALGNTSQDAPVFVSLSTTTSTTTILPTTTTTSTSTTSTTTFPYPWILATGFWNDFGVWKDSSYWID